ncbi:hypothetical protein BCV72DRAFT_246588 [Rhizopus microsporus var. microsporus]|uniref:Tc1-like transposase DDE domain-containing protein n=1 Tax=Rhizopus microsporus var. microsporus TaxID=86635 RepID=A0A1X0RID9_RHIZD|nr:hypothetical protein BCV72DRAFT_246588 [Rhizopus microsporus var. microsporus]
MNFQIFFEDGHGNAVDEYGRPEPMVYIIDEERYALETVSSHTQYLHNQPQENNFDVGSVTDGDAKDDPDACMKEASSKRAYTLYTDQGKVRFFKLVFEKVMSASAAAKQLAQMCKTDPDSIFIKHKKTGRSRILHEEHNPSAVLEQVMEQLLQKLQDLKVSKSTVYNFARTECNLSLKKAQFQPERFDWVHKWKCTDMDFRTNCIFLDESAFHINLKHTQITTILGAISALGLLKYSLRLPQLPAKKRKREGYAEQTSIGTVTVHYFSFLKATMDKMDHADTSRYLRGKLYIIIFLHN